MSLLGNVKVAKGKREDVGGYTGCKLGEGLSIFQMSRVLEKQWPLARAGSPQPWSQTGTLWSERAKRAFLSWAARAVLSLFLAPVEGHG